MARPRAARVGWKTNRTRLGFLPPQPRARRGRAASERDFRARHPMNWRAVSRSTRRLARDEDVLYGRRVARGVLEGLVVKRADGLLSLDGLRFRELDAAIGRRVLLLAAREVLPQARGIEARKVETVLTTLWHTMGNAPFGRGEMSYEWSGRVPSRGTASVFGAYESGLTRVTFSALDCALPCRPRPDGPISTVILVNRVETRKSIFAPPQNAPRLFGGVGLFRRLLFWAHHVSLNPSILLIGLLLVVFVIFRSSTPFGQDI